MPEAARKKLDRLDQEIEELQKLISKTKYNKRTQHAIGLYKARLAALKRRKESRSKKGKKEGFSVSRSGDATVVLVGFPSVGKSSLLNALTNADSLIASYEFTTLKCIPGLLEHRSAKIQILDVPGVVKGAADGTGRGKEVLQILRNADLVMVLLDVHHPKYLSVILREIHDTCVRINQKRPDVRIRKTARGGIRVGTTVKLTKLTTATVQAIVREFRIANADVLIRSDIDADQLIDVIEANRVYVPALVVVNKVDLVNERELNRIKSLVHPDLCVSAVRHINVEELKELIFDKLEFMPVYCKKVGKKADVKEPIILKRGNTVEDMCKKLHKDFVERFKYARVWGKSTKFGGQKLGMKHRLEDDDVVEIHVA